MTVTAEDWGKERSKRWIVRRRRRDIMRQCSTVGKRRLKKLYRWWLKDGCVGQQAMRKRDGDADGPRHQRLVEFLDQIRLSWLVQTSVYQNSQLELDPLRRLRPVQLCDERRDSVNPENRESHRFWHGPPKGLIRSSSSSHSQRGPSRRSSMMTASKCLSPEVGRCLAGVVSDLVDPSATWATRPTTPGGMGKTTEWEVDVKL